MQRAVARVTVSFGLLQIPMKVYLAGCNTSSPFHWLSPQLHRVQLQCVDGETKEVLSRESLSRGVEVEKGRYAAFTGSEWETICGTKRNVIEIREAIKPAHLSYHNVCKSYHLIPDRSDKSYDVLYVSLKRTKKVVLSKWFTRQGIDHLVVMYPTSTHLMMARLYYKNELRQVPKESLKPARTSRQEIKLATALLDKITSPRVNLGAGRSEFGARLSAAIEAKQTSHEDLERLLAESLKGRKK